MPFTWLDIQEGGYDMNNKIVVLLSGGLDSTTLLALALFEDREVFPLSIYYGQKHQRELDAVTAICKHFGLKDKYLDITTLSGNPSYQPADIFAGSSQTDPSIAVPHGHYADESMKVTVVPNRNMILLSLATAYAISNKADTVAYAAHAGDHAIYPDCRPQFTMAMHNAMYRCHFTPIELFTPFIAKSKAEIVTLGAQLKMPFHLTWSCYDPQPVRVAGTPLKVGETQNDYVHCGKCGTCVERKEAFQIACITDPTEYAA